MLHGLPSHHTDEIPTCGADSFSLLTPHTRSMACAPPRRRSSVSVADTALALNFFPPVDRPRRAARYMVWV